VVHRGNHPAGRDPEPLGQRLLRLAVGGIDEAHEEEVARVYAKRLERLREPSRREEPEL